MLSEEAYLQASNEVDAFLDSDAPEKTKARLQESMEILKEAYKRFSPEELAFSFNGGKDCLVLLVLVLAQLHREGFKTPLQEVYIRPRDPFPEVDEFVDECRKRYPLVSEVYESPMKSALSHFLAKHTGVRAIFVGTRRTDPFSENLHFFQATDPGWPEFIRIHPMLNWEYDDIWNIIKTMKIPYCVLYDRGYTSIGGTSTTVPNPALLDSSSGKYRPAYELKDFELERAGRTKK